MAAKKPTARVTITLRTIHELKERLATVAKAEGMTVDGLMHEALYIHLHHMEARAKPRLRWKATCPKCGTIDVTNVESSAQERGGKLR